MSPPVSDIQRRSEGASMPCRDDDDDGATSPSPRTLPTSAETLTTSDGHLESSEEDGSGGGEWDTTLFWPQPWDVTRQTDSSRGGDCAPVGHGDDGSTTPTQDDVPLESAKMLATADGSLDSTKAGDGGGGSGEWNTTLFWPQSWDVFRQTGSPGGMAADDMAEHAALRDRLPRDMSIEIFMPTCSRSKLQVNHEYTVGALMMEIEAQIKIPQHRQRLIFSVRQLNCDKTLGYYGVKSGSTVFLVEW